MSQPETTPAMFCDQCQETAAGGGCSAAGICGKTPETAALQDLLVHALKGLSWWTLRARDAGASTARADDLVVEGLFSTVTNVTFDDAAIAARIVAALDERERLRVAHSATGAIPAVATWEPVRRDLATLVAEGRAMNLLDTLGPDTDLRSLRELLLYGLKGLAAYVHHAEVLGHTDDALRRALHEGLVDLTDPALDADALTGRVLDCGGHGVDAMALLDAANTGTYGHPRPTEVSLEVGSRPGILVSGHDLRDLEELLEQTAGTGIDVYTHGEMLPAHAYPAFQRHEHFVGHYGNAWWEQTREFESFGGPVVMTTNCLVPPRDTYADRVFTTGPVGHPGLHHISDRDGDGSKDFGPVIEMAKTCRAPLALETGTVTVGFAHASVLSVADRVVDAVKSGAIRRFVVMAGCDGRHSSRRYYTRVAEQLPSDHVILTAGCAKFRYNKLDLGHIDGIPRVLDAGQCNDSYSLVVIAKKLAEAFELDDINELPVSYDIAWYEQKAVIVLLALLHLGVEHVRLGPTLPAFLSPNVARVLVDTFDLKPIGTVEDDVEAIVAGG